VTAKHLTGTKAGKALLSLLVLALLAVALQSVAFSGASFVAGSADPANAFVAGTLSHVNSMDGQIVLDAADLRPGQSRSGTLTITGTGDVTGAYVIGKDSLVDTPVTPGLSNKLVLRIEDVTGAAITLSSGTVAAFTSVAAGSIAPGQTRMYRFTLDYPATPADPALQGAAMSLRLRFTGVTP